MPTFTVTLGPGETIILPADAIVTGVFADGDISVTSSCSGVLPESSDYVCGVFYMNIDNDDNDNHPNDEDNTYYTKLFVGELEYDLQGKLNDINDPEFLNAFVPDQGIFTFTHINRDVVDDPDDNKRKKVFVYFRVAEPFYDQLELQIQSHAFTDHPLPNTQYYRPYDGEEIECGEFPL
jgi:hypothetical protein